MPTTLNMGGEGPIDSPRAGSRGEHARAQPHGAAGNLRRIATASPLDYATAISSRTTFAAGAIDLPTACATARSFVISVENSSIDSA